MTPAEFSDIRKRAAADPGCPEGRCDGCGRELSAAYMRYEEPWTDCPGRNGGSCGAPDAGDVAAADRASLLLIVDRVEAWGAAIKARRFGDAAREMDGLYCAMGFGRLHTNARNEPTAEADPTLL